MWHLLSIQPFGGRALVVTYSAMLRSGGWAARLGAKLLWLEVTNLNVAAIATYRALWFQICEVDATLYQCTDAPTETALFMARPIE